ncbi:MAG: prolyl oligopeptidase family serine peptidase [Chloroflexi bacterium]|nr:prolyl oligopeptidase family serine peptidase [Chloroflexota bacterium]
MTDKTTAPYGSWKSPVSTELIVADSVSIGDVALHGDDIYWTEMRPADNARNVIVRRAPDGTTHDLTPPEYNVRTRVHEYGGGAFCVAGDDGKDSVVYFSNFSDQRIYRQTVSASGEAGMPQPLTPEIDMRYADGEVCERRNIMVCVREDHSSSWREAVNSIVAIDLERGGSRVLVSGASFYSSPRISPDGSTLAWLSWNHPNMPWDGCELWVADLLDDGSLGERRLVAGGVDESIFQPTWSPSGVLHFVSDRTGWWNIYRAASDFDGVEPVCAMEAMGKEFGRPAWVFGLSTYGFASDERIICTFTQSGEWHIGDIDTTSGTLTIVPTPFTDVGTLYLNASHVAFTAGSPTMPMSLMRHDLADGSTTRLRSSSDAALDDGYVSRAQAIEFPTENRLTAHAFYYAPTNKDHDAPDGEKPPMIVISHGGPTSAADSSLDLRKQFWTSRGFAVLDVNYGGSSGFGTEYRRRLNENWGVVDVDDCINGAKYLVEQGLADADRLIIRGSSAGGFTTLLALTTRDAFSAGASYYGISELEALLRDTHKFESRYLDTMVGRFPEHEERYSERSPINHIDGLSAPMIVLQGLDDEIVPPNQAESMVNALREKGLPVAYLTFEGEQHGFRQAANIRRALEAELYFYSRVFGFGLADEIEPVQIDNLG